MAYVITNECTQCGICESECPTEAIVDRLNYFEIKPLICDDCDDQDEPICASVCPIDCIVYESDYSEDCDSEYFEDSEDYFDD